MENAYEQYKQSQRCLILIQIAILFAFLPTHISDDVNLPTPVAGN